VYADSVPLLTFPQRLK